MAKAFSGTGIVSGLTSDRTGMTSPTTGMQFYETDTDRVWLYDGTNWIWQSGTAVTNAQTASYVLVLSDKNKIIEMSVGSGNTLTVPLNSSVQFPVGTQIIILQTGSGQTTITPATAGVTIDATPGLKLRTQWSSVTLLKRATDTWVAMGDLVA
jgi:hypothetical protein